MAIPRSIHAILFALARGFLSTKRDIAIGIKKWRSRWSMGGSFPEKWTNPPNCDF